jgi:large subunit ribosomal protein L10
MGFVRKVKERMVRELAQDLRSSSSFVLVDYHGLTARQATELRLSLKREGLRLRVVKNSVGRFAFAEAGLKALAESAEGMNAVVHGDDPVAIAKRVVEFGDKHKALKVRRGWIDGRPVDEAEVQTLSRLPSRHDIVAGVVGIIAAPVTNFVATVAEVPGKFLRTLDAVRGKMEKSGS